MPYPMPTTMMSGGADDRPACVHFMKSHSGFLMMCNIPTLLSQPRLRRKSKISRVTTRAVNKLNATPMVRVTPNPLTGPVPM